MEEIDEIIINSLRNLHCDVDDEVTSLKHFDAELVVTAISTCLEAIVPDVKFPKKLPPSMTHKLKITSSLAEQIKDLGFREDIGYQTILYCNEAEIRRVLMFLIESLPRESSKAQVEPTGYIPCLVKEIETKVRDSLGQFWVPSCVLRGGCRKSATGNIFSSLGDSRPLRSKNLKIPRTRDSPKNEALKQYWIHHVPAVTKQCGPRELIPSLLFEDAFISTKDDYLKSFVVSRRQEDILPSPTLSNQINIEQSESESFEEVTVAHGETKLQSLLTKLKEQKDRCTEVEESVKMQKMEFSKVEAAKNEEDKMLQDTLAKLDLRCKTLSVIGSEENLEKLKNLIESNKSKLLDLTEEWNKIQAPLLEEYRSLQNAISDQDSNSQRKQSRLRKYEETRKNLKNDLKEKTQMEEQLKQKLAQINKNHNRSAYTRRILEIIGNVKKQDEEIQKILKDTRGVQREISSLTGQVDRSFTLSEELIFRDAKRDETARKAYKLLAQLRDDFACILKAVTDLGAVERECRNLQEQIDSETAKENVVKLERVHKDLEEIRKEIEALAKHQL